MILFHNQWRSITGNCGCNLFPCQTWLAPVICRVGKGRSVWPPKPKSLVDFSANVTGNLPPWCAIFSFCFRNLVLSNCYSTAFDLNSWLGLKGCCQDADLAYTLDRAGTGLVLYSNRGCGNWLSGLLIGISNPKQRGYVHNGTMLNSGLGFPQDDHGFGYFSQQLGISVKGPEYQLSQVGHSLHGIEALCIMISGKELLYIRNFQPSLAEIGTIFGWSSCFWRCQRTDPDKQMHTI